MDFVAAYFAFGLTMAFAFWLRKDSALDVPFWFYMCIIIGSLPLFLYVLMMPSKVLLEQSKKLGMILYGKQ